MAGTSYGCPSMTARRTADRNSGGATNSTRSSVTSSGSPTVPIVGSVPSPGRNRPVPRTEKEHSV